MYQVPATRGMEDDGKVWGDLCREKRVNIVYNNEPWIFEVDWRTKEMVRYPVDPVTGFSSTISWTWEILDSFIRNHHIVPNWINCFHYSQCIEWFIYDGYADMTMDDTDGLSGLYLSELYNIHNFPGVSYIPDYWFTRCFVQYA